MRDITLGETIDFKFSTHEPDTGAPITLAGTPVVSAYVGNSTTQITAGITLTVDFDGVTGLHNVRVVATSGNGFADATDVALIITTGTVDTVSAVGYKVGEFTIGRSAAQTRAADLQTRTPAALVGGRMDASAGAMAAGVINEAAFATTTGSFAPLGISRQGTAQSATATTLVLDASAPFADNSCIGSQLEVLGSTQGYWQAVDILDYDNATDTATIEAWPGATPSGTITYRVRMTAPATTAGNDAVAAAVAAELGTGSAFTAIPWNAAWDAEVESEATDALNAYDPPTRAELTTDTNSVLSAVGDVPTNAELATALAAADDAVLAAIAALNNLSAAQAKAQVVAALATDTYAEPSSVPAATASLADKIGFLMAMTRNRKTQTADTTALRNDADSGNIGTSTVSDDGTTAVVGEWT